MKLRQILIAILLPLLLSCSSSDGRIDERIEYWTERLSRTLPAGSTLSEALEIAQELDERISFSEEDEFLVIFLEELEGDGVVCSSWHLYAKIAVTRGFTGSTEIQKRGMCL